MMSNRGYDIDEEKLEMINAYQARTLNTSKEIEIDTIYSGENKENLLLVLRLNTNLNKEAVIDIIDQAKENECEKIVLVINSLKHIAAPALNEISSRLTQIGITPFTADELIVVPIDHIYSPTYRKLSTEEKENLAKQINFKELPLLRYSDIRELKLETKQQRSKLIYDPVAKHLDYEPGDIIEERGVNFPLNLMVREYVIYRYVK